MATNKKIEVKKEVHLDSQKGFLRHLGPGLITGAADDDPSGIATYSQTGAQYGFRLAWMALFTLPFMAIVQEMCARIGLVTGRGLAANIRLHFPRWVLISMTILLFLANSFNIGADLGAMAEASRLLLPQLPFMPLVALFAVSCLLLEIYIPYKQYVKYLKWLTFVLFAYVATAFAINLPWLEIFHATLIPDLHFDKSEFFLIAAILGTTISPYLFFWQTAQEIEEEILKGKVSLKQRKALSTPKEIKEMRHDVWFGMFVSNLIMFFIIVVCGATLHLNGVTNITSAAQAAAALLPFANDFSYFLFTLGIIGTGFLAVPILAGSASYAIAESFGWKHGLYKKFHQAKAFYGVIILSVFFGLIQNFIGLNPIRALIYSAVANGLIAPVAIVLILMISSNKKIMGRWVNGRVTKILGWSITVLMALAVIVSVSL